MSMKRSPRKLHLQAPISETPEQVNLSTVSFLKHYAYAAKHDGIAIDRVRGFGACGDTITLSFSIVSPHRVKEIVFETRALTMEDQKIAADNIEVYIAKLWEQAGLGRKQGKKVLVRELLMKDDRQSLEDRYRRGFKHWRQFARPAMFYCPPDVRLSGPACTSLEADVAKQIWLSVRVPKGTKPGIYQGILAVRTLEPLVYTNIAVEIEILEIHLSEPKQDLMIFYKGTIDVKRPQFFVSRKILRHQLQDIFDHGFRSITIEEVHPKLAQKMIDICEEVGFDRHLVLMNTHNLDRLKCTKVAPIIYVSDELDLNSQHEPKTITWHKHNYQMAKQHGLKSVASLWSASFVCEFLDDTKIGCAPEIIMYNLSTNRKFFEMVSASAPGSRPSYYYWNSHMEKPNLHRVLAGVYLWKSKAAGIAPYCYQHVPVYPFSPYNDFDEWEPGSNKSIPYVPLRDHCTTSPAKHGSIPTVQWEGLREGIIDLRYLTTLHEALDRARANEIAQGLVPQIEGRVSAFLDRIDLSQIIINSETQPEPFPQMNPEDLQTFREQMARDIISLQKAMKVDMNVGKNS